MEPLDVLQKVEIFQSFSAEARSHLGQRMRPRHFATGDMIVRQQDTGDSLFIIAYGLVGVWVHGEGGKSFEITRLGRGDIFGEMSLLTGDVRTATFIAATDAHLFELSKEDITPLIKKYPEIYTLLSDVLTQHILAKKTQIRRAQARQSEQEELVVHLLCDRVLQFFSRRKRPRVKVQQDVSIQLMIHKPGMPAFDAELEDITPEGISFRCAPATTLLERGDHVKIELRARDLMENPFSLSGSICYRIEAFFVDKVRALRDKYGVHFDPLTPEQTAHVEEVLYHVRQQPREDTSKKVGHNRSWL
ncbi:MAG: cyclic nucleotide-binding domain-containing protein [Deltaproteobacteria bacterium]|nr:cyclic nucleotide-binding domain-containing protein [Deltaproteobacteria bacterium]